MLKKILKRITSLPNYLAYQLFVSFGLVFALLFIIAFNLSKFDAREFAPISLQEQHFFKKESEYTVQTLNIDEVFEHNLSVETPNGFDVILVDKQTGELSGVNQSNIKPLQIFIYQAEESLIPLQRRFETTEIYGPFNINSNTREYKQYFIKAVDAQDEWFSYLIDSPLNMFLMIMLIGAPILLWLSLKITSPVRQLRLAANAVAMGDLKVNPKLETEGIIELRQVGASFNHMVSSLQELNDHQQRMLSDISHELKTPLARLQLATAILRRRLGELNEIERIETQIHKMDLMVQNLLLLSRQQLNYHLNRQIFKVENIWLNILEDTRFEAEQNNIRLDINQNVLHTSKYFINGNQTILSSALENLIRNALKYANSRILVCIDIVDDHLIITIEDDGYGVADSEYEQIFRPFYRVDDARTRETGGTGLGLAIVRNAVQQHRGNVQAMKSENLGGLKIEMSLPLWNINDKL